MNRLPWPLPFVLGFLCCLLLTSVLTLRPNNKPASLREKLEFYHYADKHREKMSLMQEILEDRIITSAEVTLYVNECIEEELKNANK